MPEENKFTEALGQFFTPAQLAKMQTTVIGIAGAGGLGSNCAWNLVRSGFCRFVLADFDVIDYSNLNRQFYFYQQVGRPKVEVLKENLLAINPALDITVHQERVDEENVSRLFSACDIIVEAFDKAACKRMLVEEYLPSGKLVVAASGLAGWEDCDAIKVHKLKDNFYLVGDLTTAVGSDKPPCAPRVTIAAAKQAAVVLNYVLAGE